jgi:hypothetical protein
LYSAEEPVSAGLPLASRGIAAPSTVPSIGVQLAPPSVDTSV